MTISCRKVELRSYVANENAVRSIGVGTNEYGYLSLLRLPFRQHIQIGMVNLSGSFGGTRTHMSSYGRQFATKYPYSTPYPNPKGTLLDALKVNVC